MTDQYAVFGNPISHSKSPRIHALFAEQTKQDIEYNKVLVEHGQFASEAKHFFDDGGKGLNITVPFKLDAYQFAEQNGSVSERAKLAGAVNTLKKLPDGKIFGDNTDGAGLVRDITQNLGWTIKGKNVQILGAGGAVRGVLGPLLEQQPKEIIIYNRTQEKADDLVNLFKRFGNISVRDQKQDEPSISIDLIINGTSASLTGDKPLLMSQMKLKLAPDAHAYDMVYGKLSALEAELLPTMKVFDGLGMLVEQAAESFYIWCGIKPETKSVIEKIRKEL